LLAFYTVSKKVNVRNGKRPPPFKIYWRVQLAEIKQGNSELGHEA